ncbi:Amidase signature domain protein [Niveomyces insectorum RCEF 264]|uniref:Amidase signature domain protein n=1 Tax=Niveomyces insectorum RCEF 264 TaxID=1081102 RepID=A0A162LCB4_9HYPO|nr:Amidase signature domain protein [Niveomyces insectorum RCEF 264]
MAQRSLLGLVKVALFAAVCTRAQPPASSAPSLTILNKVDDGAFTFTLTTSNFSVNTDDFWTGTYYVPPERDLAPVAVYETQTPPLLGHLGSETAFPFTVLVTDASVVTGDVLRQLVATYSEDDVFNAGFLKGVQIIATQTQPCSLDGSAIEYLETLGVQVLVVSADVATVSNSAVFNTTVVPVTGSIPPGPYVAQLAACGALSLRKVFALFSDYQGAFYNGVTANDDGSYSALSIWNTEQHSALIPVPSRLYTSMLDATVYPLAGLRFALKDLMPVRGLILTGGSRAYARLYDTPANQTSPAIAHLLSLGAVLVGRSKLTTFAFGAYAYQTMDYSYSWNIRGDGFMGLSASSFGSAAAIAAYNQLDFSVGSDTLGSVRNPADRAGVYGIRPSWGAIDLTSVIPSSTSMDTLGVMARSASVVHKVMGSWQIAEKSPLESGNFTLPKKIFYPVEWFPVNTTAAQTVIDTWLGNMTMAMGMEIVPQNVTALFQETVGSNNTLADYTSNFALLTNYDNWHLFGKQFVADYQSRFQGRWPEADNEVLAAWRLAQTLVPSNKTEIEATMATFTEFFNSKVVPYDNQTCTEGFWVYQIEDTGGGVPEYRDVLDYDYFPPFTPMRAASIAPFARLVDVTVPIGVVPYDSVISLREEELVITLNFVAHQGCDAVLMEFLTACEAAGFCKPVTTGSTAW